jgi:hypothetical protein
VASKVTPTPTPLPDYGVHVPATPITKPDYVLAAFLVVLAVVSYWLPTILAIWRRNSRMGLVIFFNLGAFMIFPWVGAMTVVLGEPSRRPRTSPLWTPEQAAAWAPTPVLPQAPVELPANVTQLRRGRDAPC